MILNIFVRGQNIPSVQIMDSFIKEFEVKFVKLDVSEIFWNKNDLLNFSKSVFKNERFLQVQLQKELSSSVVLDSFYPNRSLRSQSVKVVFTDDVEDYLSRIDEPLYTYSKVECATFSQMQQCIFVGSSYAVSRESTKILCSVQNDQTSEACPKVQSAIFFPKSERFR